jgi:hypothetical protein
MKSKRQLKAEQRFDEAVTDFVLSQCERPGTFYEYELDTPAGLLHISVHEGWVATRFDDVALGTKFTESCGRSCNPYSGKWNFHYADTLGINVVLADLHYWFGLLMAWEPKS